MSATIFTVITCDSGLGVCPGDSFGGGDMSHETAGKQRASFTGNADAGGRWVYRNGKDYCPTCAKALHFIR